MNWSDIKRSLDSEFKRLEDERDKNMEEDEKLADFLVRKFEEVQQDSENLKTIVIDTESEVHKKLSNETKQKLVKVVTGRTYGDHKRLVTVVKGSSVSEFNQNWKEKVEAS